MIIIYVTLNNSKEAEKIGHQLLEQNLANCVNWFPITCMYKYKGKIEKEPEIVMIIKTKEGKFEEIEKVIKANISYDNFIGQIKVDKINENFASWLIEVVK